MREPPDERVPNAPREGEAPAPRAPGCCGGELPLDERIHCRLCRFLRALLRWLLSNVFQLAADPPAWGGADGRSFLVNGCAGRAVLVVPQACIPRFVGPAHDNSLRVANRTATTRDVLGRMRGRLRDMREELRALDAMLAALRNPPPGTPIPDGTDGRIRDLAAARDALAARIAEIERLGGDPDAVPPLDDDQSARWTGIREAGRTDITHRICLYWRDSKYKIGVTDQRCCTLMFIRVVTEATIRLNPTKKLYIRMDGDASRIPKREYDKLAAADQAAWHEATLDSIEVHERAHVADYHAGLTAFLEQFRFYGFATTDGERNVATMRICERLGRLVNQFRDEYTLADLVAYPHGASEAAAIAAQREAMTNAAVVDWLKDRKAAYERGRATQLTAFKAAEVEPCPLPQAAEPVHCLDRPIVDMQCSSN